MIEFKKLDAKYDIGVIVTQMDLSKKLDAQTILDIQHLLYKHKVVLFRKQNINDIQMENFALKLGPLFVSDKGNPVLGSDNSTNSIVVVGNQASEFKNPYLGFQEVLPHTDHQWTKTPSAISILYALDIHAAAAPTTWTDMMSAYSLLDNETKKEISNLKSITYNPFYRPFGSIRDKYVNKLIDIPPGEVFEHPLVRTHPITKEKILYMHRAYEMEFVDIEYDEGFNLWNKLNFHIDNITSKCTHHWKNGDLIIWDNRATLHYRPEFDQKIRRVLKRISIGGEKPF
jgi:taurine dioxygenase